MQAIRVHEYGGPEVMKLESVPDPKPGAGQVLVRLRAAGVNPVDTYIRSGTYALLPDKLPYTPGSDGAGEVAAVGEGVTDFKRGDRVFVHRLGVKFAGTYAQMTVAPVANVARLPAGLSFEQGAAIGVPHLTAHYALHTTARAKPGETVLVHGASGAVGTAAVQMAAAHGLTVIGTAGTERGLQIVREQGAQHALRHGTPDVVKQVMDLTGGRGVDVIVEMLANANLGRDLEMLARNGRVAVVGSRGTVEVNPREIMRREAVVSGMMLWNVPGDEIERMLTALQAGFESGKLNPVVGRKFPLAEAPQAHVAVMSPGAAGKIVLTMD